MNNLTFRAMIVEETRDNQFVRNIKDKSIFDLPDGDVLVRVSYSSLNYKDALSAIGNRGVTRKYPHTPGIDAAGTVAESSNKAFQTGDAVIDAPNHTIAIEVAFGTDVTALKPVLSISEDAKVTPDTSLTQDFTSPVTYTVTAEDGTTTQDWVATVSVLVSTPKIPESNVTLYPIRSN